VSELKEGIQGQSRMQWGSRGVISIIDSARARCYLEIHSGPLNPFFMSRAANIFFTG